MKITLCSSARFFERLYEIKEELEKQGHEVFLPSMKNYHDLEETALAKIHYNLIKDQFKKIDNSDAIFVANFDKDIKGYIGGSCLLEIGKAFDKGIPIYLLNEIPDISYKEEIKAMKPIVIGMDFKKINLM